MCMWLERHVINFCSLSVMIKSICANSFLIECCRRLLTMSLIPIAELQMLLFENDLVHRSRAGTSDFKLNLSFHSRSLRPQLVSTHFSRIPNSLKSSINCPATCNFVAFPMNRTKTWFRIKIFATFSICCHRAGACLCLLSIHEIYKETSTNLLFYSVICLLWNSWKSQQLKSLPKQEIKNLS